MARTRKANRDRMRAKRHAFYAVGLTARGHQRIRRPKRGTLRRYLWDLRALGLRLSSLA